MFELNGEPVALDFLQGKAKEYNMDIDSYINKMESKGLKKVEPGKITPPKEDNQGVPVEENATPKLTATVSPSVDISLALPEQPKTGTQANTEFIPDPISKEREEEILSEYDKISNIDIEQEAINKKKSKLKRFQQGEFKLEEKEEFDYWKSSNGKLFEESEVLSKQEIEDKKQANQTVFLSKLPDYERKEILSKSKKAFEEQVSFINKKTDKVSNFYSQYENIKDQPITSTEDFIYRKNLINQIKFEGIERRRALSNLDRTADLIDDFKRSYAFSDIAEQSFKTIGTDVAIGLMSTIDMLKTEEGQKASYLNNLVDYREGLQQFAEENLAKPISIENVNSLDKAVVWGTNALANQLPTLAMAFTGQAAIPLFFATGYGSKMSDFELGARKAKKELPLLEADLKLEQDPEKRKKIQKDIDYYSRYVNVSDVIKLLTATAHGGAEAIFEGLTTLKLVGDLQNIGNNILKAGGSKKAVYNAFKAAPMSIGLESLGESATQITQNVADILIFGDDKSILENVPEAAAQGALFGSGFAIPNLGTAINAGIQSTISTRSDNAEIKNKLKEINDLTFELQSNGQLAPEDKKEIQKNIQQKINELVKTTDITRARFQRLSYEQQQEVFDLEKQVNNSIKRWRDIGASNMSEGTKNSLRKEIKNEIQSLQDKKQSLLESGDARLKDLETISTENLLVAGDVEQSKQQYLRWKQGVETFIKKYNLPIEVSIENLTEEQFKQYGDVGGSYLNKKITIYENIAAFKNPSTPLHELTHAMLETFGLSKENFDTLEKSFEALLQTKKEAGEITDKQYNDTIKKYEAYKNDKKTKEQASEELLTSFIDAISENTLDKKDVSFLTKIGEALKNIIASKSSKIEAENFDLNTADGVYNFLTQFAESVAQGKKLKKIVGVEIPEEIKKETKAFSKTISGENIQKIFDEKGKDGTFEIIEAYKPLTTKLTNKYRNVPGFDFELLQSEIEIGKRGLLDLINAYDPSKGATLNTYVQGQLANRSIEAANRILDTEFKLDVTEAKGVTDTVTAEETIEREEAAPADEIKSLRKEIGLSEELVTKVKDAVVKTFGTKLPNPQDPKFRFELQKRFRTELKKPLSKFVGKQADYEAFLRDNFESVYSKMPQSLINRRFKEFAEPVLDKNGKQLREQTAEGNKIYVKKKISKAEWIKYFIGADVKSSTKGARKTAIVEGMAEEIAFDATMEVLNDPDVISKYQDIAGITGEILPENFKSLIAKQVDRAEGFKFSKSIVSNTKFSKSPSGNLNVYHGGTLKNIKKAIPPIYFSPNEQESIVYAKGRPENELNQSIDEGGTAVLINAEINEKNVVDESVIFNEIKKLKLKSKEQGENIDDLNLYELIDTSFPTSLNTKDLNKLFESLKNKKIKAAKFIDEGISVDRTLVQNIVVFDTSVIENPKYQTKFSKSLTNIAKAEYNLESQELAKILDKTSLDKLSNKYPLIFDAIIYEAGPKVFPSTAQIKFSLSLKEKAAAGKIIKKLQNDILKNIESENVNFTDDLNVFILNKFNEEVEKDLNLDKILENVINATNSFITNKTGKNLISKAVLDTDGKLTRNYFLKIKQATGIALKKEIAELGYESSKKLLENRLKNASENDHPTIISNWFINESKAITTFNGLSDITKIQDIYNEVIKPVLKKYNVEGFKVDKNPKGRGKKLFYNNNPIDRYKSTTDIKRNFAEYIPQINKEAKNAKEYILGILDYYKNNNLINEGKAHIKLLANDQIGALRKIAKAGMYVENLPTKETTLEHETPVLEITLASNDFLDGKISREQLEKEFDNAQINLVTKNVDRALTAANLKSSGKNRMQNNLVKEAVKNDIKGGIEYKNIESVYKEEQTKYSKSLNKEFNKILEQSTGTDWAKRFSPVEARVLGKGKGKKFFIPYSADDFVGLLYATLGTKKQGGNEQMEWYKENLLRPFSRGIQQYEAAKQQALRDWQVLKKEAKKDVPGGLGKKNATGLTNQDAVRIYIWTTQGMDIPGTEGSPELVQQNLEIVKNDEKLKAFADRLMALNPEGYPEPSNNWDSGDITTDIVSYINGVKRSEFLTEWKQNADEIFSDQNKEKLRALYGNTYIEALDDILHRMRTGTNRKSGVSKIERQFMDWTNNSVGAIMFFNARSAVLQTLSAVNFINFSDNNPINAGIAFANQRQYWNDFSTLFNSDFLKQRRTGLQTDVNADEIARAAKTSTNKARAALSALLKFGFTPTQIADSFAIASGGATMYRNRINKYLKEGLEQKEAEQKAFTDFQEIAEETQQSARPDRISLQQASSLGRLVLAFGNTPMQYARLTKKATLDLINGRGDWKTNISKIAYYSVIQNIIFSALQQGMFALLFNDEDDDKEKSRLIRIGNSSLDTLLRGAGVYGAAAATVKNMIIKVIEESKKSRPDYTKVAIEATALSPPINSKLRKLVSAGKTFTYKQSKEKVFTEGFSLENPAFLAGGKILSAATNLPADRIVQKADHLKTAMESETELWQSIALSLGWSEWDLNMIEKQTKKPKVSYKRSKSRSRPKRKTRK